MHHCLYSLNLLIKPSNSGTVKSNSLYRICKFNNQLNTECIEEAINLLKSVLSKNEFNLYFHKDGKLYKKNAEGIKRVKDMKELLNEREKRCK